MEIDAVVSTNDETVWFEVYRPGDLENRGSFADLNTAWLRAIECVGYNVNQILGAELKLISH